MSLNPSFPNYANSAAGTEVIAWTVVGGQPLYRLPLAYVNTGFGMALVCEGSTVEAPTFPEGVYAPDPYIESAGTISGTPTVGSVLTFTPGAVTGTAPITVVYNWIRYAPGGTSLIVGAGLNYTVQTADLTYQLVVQTVATGLDGAIGTQTVPFGPIVPSAPIITDPGTISSTAPTPPPPPPSGGTILSATLNSPGANYVWLLGTSRSLIFTGDGAGAVGTASLNPVGNIASIALEDTQSTVVNGTGQITLAGEGSEVDAILNWVTIDPTTTNVDPLATLTGGTGWTQANIDACIAGTYGTITFTGDSFSDGPTIVAYVGCPILSTAISNGGSNYTTCTITVQEETPEAGFATPAVLTAVISVGSGGGSPAPGTGGPIYPTQTAYYTGPTVTGFSPQVSWQWGYLNGTSFVPLQLGGSTYYVTENNIGQELFVRVTATNTGGTVTDDSPVIEVDGSAPTPVVLPRIGPQQVVVGDRVSGQQGTWAGYPAPQVTDWGFAYFLVPTPTPIVGADKVYSYDVVNADAGQRLCFYVTATNSSGTVTAYSAPTEVVYDYLQPGNLPTLTGFQSPAQVGDVLRGTPGTFDPGNAYQYSFFATVNPNGSLVEIAGTRNTTSFTLTSVYLGAQIVYASFGENDGKYGVETLTTRSNSTGVIRQFVKILTPGTITFAGDAPLIGSTCQVVAGTTFPALQPALPGPALSGLQIGYLQGSVPAFFQVETAGWTSPYSFVVPVEADGYPLFFNWTATYNDTVQVQTVTSQYNGITPPAEGVAPYNVTPGVWNPANVYNPGQALAWTPGTYAGVPTPAVTWQWLRVLPDGFVLLQNGGLTYTLPDDSAGWKVEIQETARNQAGTVDSFSAIQTVGGPLPVWTRLPVVTGSGLMTPTAEVSMNCIPPTARDPITGDPNPVTWQWIIQYPGQTPIPLGHPFTEYIFQNENGRWTGAQLYLQGTATNSVGTVTCESNKVTMVGTPRVITEGGLNYRNLPKVFGLTPCTYDGGGQTTTSDWGAGVRTTGGQILAGFNAPATSTTQCTNGTGTGTGTQTITNTQGTTQYAFPPINVQFI